jgi:hypothetical protein
MLDVRFVPAVTPWAVRLLCKGAVPTVPHLSRGRYHVADTTKSSNAACPPIESTADQARRSRQDHGLVHRRDDGSWLLAHYTGEPLKVENLVPAGRCEEGHDR